MAQESKSAEGHGDDVARVTAMLALHLEEEAGVLDFLLDEAGRGRSHGELWKQLHQAAVRDDMLPELAFAYEQLARGRRLRAAPPAVQAEVLMHAASFFVEVFGDGEGATELLERVLTVAPGHPEAFATLERLLIAAQSWLPLTNLYVAAAERMTDAREQVAMLRRAAELVDRLPGEVERAISIYERILRVDPNQRRFRRTLEARYLLAGRTEDAAAFLEQVLGATPPPEDDEAFAMRTRLMVLYAGELGQVERALPHVEELLRRDPAHEQARLIAQRLLAQPETAPRAAAVLSDVYQQLGSPAEAAAMLAVALEHARGRERTALQRRLGVLRYRQLDDATGALPLLEAAVLAEPGDDETRAELRGAAGALDRRLDAARTLARAAGVTKDAALRARIGTELGDLLVEAGDAKRARAVFQEVVDRGGDDGAVLTAARQLSALYEAGRERQQLARVLELLARVEPDGDERFAATERLAAVLGELGDARGAMSAWRPWLGTPRGDAALAALEQLYRQAGAEAELAEILELRARATAGETAEGLAARAAELRGSSDPARALGTWRALREAHGPSRAVHARLMPLLEEGGHWDEVAVVLGDEVPLAPVSERAAILVRLAEVRATRLDDAPGALDAHRLALSLEPGHPESRRAVHSLLEQPAHRLGAAEVLRDDYRIAGAWTELASVLEVVADAGEPATRFEAWEQAASLFERELDDRPRALEVSTRAVGDAARHDSARAAAWLERAARLGEAVSAERRAALLAEALGDGPVDNRALARLAEAAGKAWQEAGEPERALGYLRRAAAFEHSPELEQRLETLGGAQRGPEELAAAARGLEAAGDLGRAAELYRRALGGQPASVDVQVRLYALLMRKAEETLGNRAQAVARVSREVLAVPAEHMDAAFAISLLLPEVDGVGGTVDALRELTTRSVGAMRTALELVTAELLLDRTHRVDEAMDLLEELLARDAHDPALLPVLRRALARPAARPRAAAMLERAAEASEDPELALAIVLALMESPPAEGGDLQATDNLVDRWTARPEVALGLAVHAAAGQPQDDALWERAERLARELGRPRPVLDAYRELLARPGVEPAVLAQVGRRAVDFHEEWLDEDDDSTVELLRRLWDIDRPWAFERLKLTLGASGRWPALFAVYDDAIAAAEDDATVERLVDEAAQVAKDFADDPDRAIQYLERLAQLRGDDTRTDAARERLYERTGKRHELIDLLSGRLAGLPADDAQPLRARIASLWLEGGDEPAALRLALEMLELDAEHQDAHGLLERMVFAPIPSLDANAATEDTQGTRQRLGLGDLQRAAALLKIRYASSGRHGELARVIGVELETETDDAGRIRRHGERASLRREMGDERGAFEDYAALLALEPEVAEHRRTLSELADRLGEHRRLAEALAAAAATERGGAPLLRAGLLRDAAALHRDRLDEGARAAEMLGSAAALSREDHGALLEVTRELEPLLAAAGRDAERCAALETMAMLETDASRRRAAFGEVARLSTEVLGDPARAVRAWRARVADDPGDLEALDGLVSVLRSEKRWRDLVEALELRAAEHGAKHAERGRADRVEVARLHERELGSRADAIAAWQRVRDGFGPDDESFEALSQLLSAEARWAELAALLSAQAATSDPPRRLTLLRHLGDLSRGELAAPATAAIAYGDALAIDARDRDARAGLRALLDGGVVREAAVDALARSYVETGDWEEAAEMTAALRPGEDVPASLARKLWWGVALYFRDDKGDHDAAELALRRALLHDDNNPEILASLAAVQRRKPGRPLVDTLVRLSEARGGDLDLLREAADIGIRVLGDREVGPQNCERLLELAVSRWAASGKKEGGKRKRLSDVAEDPRSPRAVARWALTELLRMAAEDKDHARTVTLLMRGAELPFDRGETRRMRRDAAVVAARDLADPDEAVRIYRGLFDEDAADEVAAAETEAFAALLEGRGAIADLAALWERRAATLEETGDTRAARELWSRAAVIDEERLRDVDRAMADHGHAATLGSNASRAALARLHTERGSLGEAAEAVDGLHADAEPAVIAEASLRLAEALLAASDEGAARARLEATSARLASDSGQAGTEVRERLAALYRAGERWDELAALEEASARLAPAPEARLAHLREAASLHLERRDDPSAAVPLLEESVQLAPEDAVLGLTHIEALAAIGKPADALRAATAQIEGYRGRRPKERALSHYAAARAAEALGDAPRALAELDAAAKIDHGHEGVLYAMGRLASAAGDLDRAVRAYQALLLLRQPQEVGEAQRAHDELLRRFRRPGAVPEGAPSRAELLLELARIARRRNDAVRAEEYLQSAREAAGDDARLLALVAAETPG